MPLLQKASAWRKAKAALGDSSDLQALLINTFIISHPTLRGFLLLRPRTPGACIAAQPGDHMLDHFRVGRAKRFFSAIAGSALFPMSRGMSISILVARSSAEADWLTS